MPISMCQLYSDFKGRENTWQGGHARPASFESWVHEVQIEMLNELILSLGNNQTVTDNLRPFLRSAQLSIRTSTTGGVINYPTDYRRFSSLRFLSRTATGPGCLCTDIPVVGDGGVCRELTEEEKVDAMHSTKLCKRSIEMVANQFWGSICDDRISPPSVSNPFATQLQNGFEIAPQEIGVVILDYIAIPARPRLLYTRDPATNNFTCLSTSSTLPWGEEMLPEILARVKKRYSAFTRNQEGYMQGEQERQITKS